MEDDELCSARDGDPGRVVEHPHGHALLLVSFDVAHEAGDRCVHRERDSSLTRQRSQALGPRVVHPEPALEVDLAGRVAALEQERDGGLRSLARRHARGTETKRSH